jgi:hypothetical protein
MPVFKSYGKKKIVAGNDAFSPQRSTENVMTFQNESTIINRTL